MADVLRRDHLAAERTRRLEIFQPESLQVFRRRQALNAEGVGLIGKRVIPEPMLAAVGEDDERGVEVLGVAARLLLGLVGIGVLPLRFQHAGSGAK